MGHDFVFSLKSLGPPPWSRARESAVLVGIVLLSPTRLGRVDWTDELLNWITKYEMIEVALTLIGVAVPCGNTPTR
jgi:hypothetical protein